MTTMRPHRARTMPGVLELLETLHHRKDLAQGLLTGNVRRGDILLATLPNVRTLDVTAPLPPFLAEPLKARCIRSPTTTAR